MFLQIHALTSYPSTLLNRDDVGMAKRLSFGGVTRTRISSQCLKRHWRTHEGNYSLLTIHEGDGIVPSAVRSRRIFEELIRMPMEQGSKLRGIAPEIAEAVAEALMSHVLGESVKKGESRSRGEEPVPDEKTPREKVESNQVVTLGRPEIAFLQKEAFAIAKTIDSPGNAKKAVKGHFTKEKIANLQALRHGAGLDAALFGRMVTSDILARCDAAVHVAHAFTTHAQAVESDYFSVVDDLFAKGEDPQAGSGHIGNSELTSGLFYSYVVVDVPLLVSNLEGCDRKTWMNADRTLASEVLARLIHLIATVSPGAKLGATAPYAYAQAMVLETGVSQPRTLSNAFMNPVDSEPDLLRNTYEALALHVLEMDAIYGNSNERRFFATRPIDRLHEIATREERGVAGLSAWVASQVQAAQ